MNSLNISKIDKAEIQVEGHKIDSHYIKFFALSEIR